MPNAPVYPWAEYLVTPRYLAGSSGTGDAGFAPVAHWPHHRLDDGPCQLLVTSPDGRIRIGWFGDDFELWKIGAAEDAVSAPRWTATFNHVTPAEIVAGLTTALEHDYSEATQSEGRFLAGGSLYWADGIQPLIDAGWSPGAAEYGTVEVLSPDRQAGAFIDNRHSSSDEAVTLWAGPPGWGTRAEAVFSSRTPSHLIAATATTMTDPAPVIREGHAISRSMEHRVTLTPLHPPTPAAPRAPTPLDVRRTQAARARSTLALPTQAARPVIPAPRQPPGPPRPGLGR
ncbi:DUF317 domain-containing protein [Streptomyces sp. CA-111067]|uniref:DUF317 domain-containing protein n=1 Tax=Streptomyces sp. CA-111067 TaxID=3240046 RepID=UPI003D968EC4